MSEFAKKWMNEIALFSNVLDSSTLFVVQFVDVGELRG